MELYSLRVFSTVVDQGSFSRAAEKLLRTQPAVSLAMQRLENEIGEKLIDRSARDLVLTDVGRTVLEYARRFESLRQELDNALHELRDKSGGRLVVGANESSTVYLVEHIERFRRLYPKVKVQVRRSQSSQIPNALRDGTLELGVLSYDPLDERLEEHVIYNDTLAFVVSPQHRFARRRNVSITELGMETFIAHNVMSPYRELVLGVFRRHKVALNMDLEMPTLDSIRKLVQRNHGVAFVPKMCVRQELEQGVLREIKVNELHVERQVRLLYARGRTLSHAARAFLEVVLRPAAKQDATAHATAEPA